MSKQTLYNMAKTPYSKFAKGLEKVQQAVGVDLGKPGIHTVLKTDYTKTDLEPEHAQILFGMGCFWGAEKFMWELGPDIIHTTCIGYSNGPPEPKPTYDSVGTGKTGHVEVIKVVYKKSTTTENSNTTNSDKNLNLILKTFWDHHDPTQENGQGFDIGPNYKSTIFCQDQNQLKIALESKDAFQKIIDQKLQSTANEKDERNKLKGKNIVTDIAMIKNFFLGEDMHQQYLDKHKWAPCSTKGNGMGCPLEFGNSKTKSSK